MKNNSGGSQDGEGLVGQEGGSGIGEESKSKCDSLKDTFNRYAPSIRTMSTGCTYVASITFFVGLTCIAASNIVAANKSDILSENEKIVKHYADDPDSQGWSDDTLIAEVLGQSSDNTRIILGETVEFFKDTAIGTMVTSGIFAVAAVGTHVVASKRENSEVEMVFGDPGFTPG